MAQAPSHAFDTAEAQLATLTERQREVLQLVARGHTNPEIADTLGITLDGAKWHVSELLGKLGLETREELAEFWEWRRSPVQRFSRTLRSFAVAPLLKVAGSVAGVAVVAGIGVGAWALFSGGTGGNDVPGTATATLLGVPPPPFALTAEFESANAIRSEGGIDPEFDVSTGTLQWWYRSSDDWKWQVSTDPGKLDSRMTVLAAHDGTTSSYDGTTNTWWQSKTQILPGGSPMPPMLGTFMGPVSWYAKDTDAFLDILRSAGNGQPRQAEVTGDATFLGRHTVIIETPGSYSSSSGPGTPTAETPDGTMRIWLDPERMVVMQMQNETSNGSYTMRVTKLDWDASPSADDLRFEPPEGAEQVEDQSGWSAYSTEAMGSSRAIGSSAGGALQAPAPFFEPAYTPPKLQVRNVEQQTATGNGPPVLLTADYVASDDSMVTLTLQESTRADGLPDALKAGTPTKVGQFDGWLTADDTDVALTWEQDGLALSITATNVPQDEVLKMAASMRPGTSTAVGIGAGAGSASPVASPGN